MTETLPIRNKRPAWAPAIEESLLGGAWGCIAAFTTSSINHTIGQPIENFDLNYGRSLILAGFVSGTAYGIHKIIKENTSADDYSGAMLVTLPTGAFLGSASGMIAGHTINEALSLLGKFSDLSIEVHTTPVMIAGAAGGVVYAIKKVVDRSN